PIRALALVQLLGLAAICTGATGETRATRGVAALRLLAILLVGVRARATSVEATSLQHTAVAPIIRKRRARCWVRSRVRVRFSGVTRTARGVRRQRGVDVRSLAVVRRVDRLLQHE